jgi:hypothetical protein
MKALKISVKPTDTVNDMGDKMGSVRPDMMRSRFWNIVIAALCDKTFTPWEYNDKSVRVFSPNGFFWERLFSAFGYTKYAKFIGERGEWGKKKTRNAARQILGVDPRGDKQAKERWDKFLAPTKSGAAAEARLKRAMLLIRNSRHKASSHSKATAKTAGNEDGAKKNKTKTKQK